MPDMDSFSIKDLAKIIERDSKDATYKFALLRGTIEIIQENDNYKSAGEQGITFPLGLLVLKWIEYYYPILSSDSFIPQKYGDSKSRTIAFRPEFERVIELCPTTRFPDQLFYDLKNGIKDPDKIQTIKSLVSKIRQTIVKQPMHYLGGAINRGGELYNYNNDVKASRTVTILNLNWIIDTQGTFTIPAELYHVMQVVGSFVTGTHSLIFRWAEFTSRLSREHPVSTSDMIALLKRDLNERDILQAKNYYAEILSSGELFCTWSGERISNDLHIDHMVPFVAYRNNDLWNLLPARGKINIRKSDRIPSEVLLKNEIIKERIILYWERMFEKYPEQFMSEIQVSLLGRTRFDHSSWKNISYDHLIGICNHMIEERGFDPWVKV